MYIQSSIVSHKHITQDEIEFLENECDPTEFVYILDGDDSEPRSILTSETFQTFEFWTPDMDGEIVVFDNDHPDANRLRQMGHTGSGYWGNETYVKIEWDYTITETQQERDKLSR